jgi:hypothetical protein
MQREIGDARSLHSTILSLRERVWACRRQQRIERSALVSRRSCPEQRERRIAEVF